jgi:hypothetical protein
MIDREAIFQALFNLVKDLPGFVTTSRRARLVKDVAPDEMPALFLEQLPEVVENQGQGLPSKYFLKADLMIYVSGADPAAIPSSLLNPLVDAVCAAIEPDADEENQTLGGRVQYCRVNGQIDRNDGIVSGSPWAFIPVEILVP